jgi:hypothetical protein
MGALFSSLMGKPVEVKVVNNNKNQPGVISPLHHNSNKNTMYSKGELANKGRVNEAPYTGRNLRDGMFEQNKVSLRTELNRKENELRGLQSTQPTNSQKVAEVESQIQDIKKDLGTAGGRSRKIKLKLKRKKRAKSLVRR